ncbi:hypothetical protein [Clostridium sp. YIM B02551]|uniref:hypothetical protein n=1 Tax=Clostridium sp. YIM B02551 TaxID=2910679 RepID=UPI001EEACF22|nr:hypothetical protein [Clostridium sp. YIM B02551]
MGILRDLLEHEGEVKEELSNGLDLNAALRKAKEKYIKKDCQSSPNKKPNFNIDHIEEKFKNNIEDGQVYTELTGKSLEIEPKEIRDKLEDLK